MASATPSPDAVRRPLKVVVSFSVLADMVKQIAGDDVSISMIVPFNKDPHTYQPTPQDVRLLVDADLVIINGLTFEGWLERLIQSSGYKGEVLIASQDVQPRLLNKDGGKTPDPHAWHHLKNGLLYIQTIAQKLIEKRPDLKTSIAERTAAYVGRLVELDESIRNSFARIPPQKRLVVTTHDAFYYYGAAYKVTFFSPIGINTDEEPSAAAIAALVTTIREKNIQAVFIETLSNRRLIEQISAETGAGVDGVLFADSLSDRDGAAPTYEGMLRHNSTAILKALGASFDTANDNMNAQDEAEKEIKGLPHACLR